MSTEFKQEYWKRRGEGLRGQGEKMKPISVAFSDDEHGYPKQGQHLVQIRGKGLQRISRSQHRQRLVGRHATAKNYAYQRSKLGFAHVVNQPGEGFARMMARAKR